MYDLPVEKPDGRETWGLESGGRWDWLPGTLQIGEESATEGTAACSWPCATASTWNVLPSLPRPYLMPLPGNFSELFLPINPEAVWPWLGKPSAARMRGGEGPSGAKWGRVLGLCLSPAGSLCRLHFPSHFGAE